jgi:GT2 family glycosyltransferase
MMMSTPPELRPRAPGTGDEPDVSVIIVTWNVRAATLACIEAVLARSDGLALEVIVVDNGSVDGTADAIRARFPDVRLLEPGVNLGFPRANNFGVQHARGRHVLFLNPDTVAGDGALRACFDVLESDDSVGVVGCRLTYPDGTLQRESGRRIYRLRHLLTELFYLHVFFPDHRVFGHQLMGDWDHRDDRDVEAVSGAFMMARREVLAAVGGLPDELFMYHEDQAFCLRARRAGWRIRFVGSVATVHLGGQSSQQRTDSRFALLEGEYKIRLIREQQGAAAVAVARVLFGARALLRLGLAGASYVLPGGARLRARYARALDARMHLLHLRWALAPGIVPVDFGAAPSSGQPAPAARRPAPHVEIPAP